VRIFFKLISLIFQLFVIYMRLSLFEQPLCLGKVFIYSSDFFHICSREIDFAYVLISEEVESPTAVLFFLLF
jgi:hypothetical protein